MHAGQLVGMIQDYVIEHIEARKELRISDLVVDEVNKVDLLPLASQILEKIYADIRSKLQPIFESEVS